MTVSFTQWLGRLPYTDPLKRQQASLFQIIVFAALFAMVAGFTVLALFPQWINESGADFAVDVLVLSALLAALAWLRQGHLSRAVWSVAGIILAWQVWFMLTAGLELVFVLFLPIVLVGLFAGRRSLWVMVLMSWGAVIGAALRDAIARDSLLLFHLPSDLLFFKALGFLFVSGALGLLLDWFTRIWQRAVASAEAREKEAAVHAQELAEESVIRAQMTESLRQAEQRYRTFIENTAEGIWRFECEMPMPVTLSEAEQLDYVYRWGFLAECNHAMAQMYGFAEPAELLGARLNDLLPRADPRNEAYLRQLIRNGYRIEDAESHEIDRYGQPRVFVNTLFAIVEEGGHIRSIWGIQRDITERRRLETAEQEQRALAQSLSETAALLNRTLNLDEVLDGILSNVARMVPQDASAVILVEGAQARLARIYGLPSAELNQRLLSLRFPLDERSFLRTLIECRQLTVIADSQTEDKWVPLTEAPWIRAAVSAPLIVQEKVVGLLMLISATPNFFSHAHGERVQAFADQAAIAITNAQRYDAAAELAALYRASAPLLNPGGDVAGLAAAIASAVTREFNLADCGVMLVDEAAGELIRVARTGAYRVTANSALPLSGPGLTVAAYQTQAPVYAPDVRADPRYLPNESDTRSEVACPLRVPDATQASGYRVIGVLDLQSPELNAFDERDQRILINFAERAALALENMLLLERLVLARRVAEEASQLKSEFLANTSHELRTPLTAILGSLDLVLAGLCDSPEEQTTFLRMAHTASRNLLAIVNDLLDIAKIEAGKMVLTPLAFDANQLLKEVEGLLRVQAEAKGLTLDMPPLHPEPLVHADSTRARQVLVNLVGNAIKFTEHGGVRVEMRVWPEAECLEVRVQDTGIGIPPEKLAKLFQPFVQADGSTTRRYGGTGLGLHIARHLAELMGGTLALTSAGLGRGSEARLTLPLARPPELPAL